MAERSRDRILPPGSRSPGRVPRPARIVDALRELKHAALERPPRHSGDDRGAP